jgi:SAM-dependent methyltransferase
MTTNAVAKEILTNADFDQLKTRLKATWMTGDYDLFSRYLEKDAKVFYQRLGITPGTRLLDVGCGAGQLALIAARAGAKVTGCDIATNWLEQARTRAAAEGLEITFEEGDAESLPYQDAQFDAVSSMFGAMFAPRPELVAAELTRVCRPGGTIAMANWTPSGFIGQMFKTIARHIAPSGMPSPALWGDEATVRDRFRSGIANLKLTPRACGLEYPFSPDAVVEFFRVNYGPMTRAFASLDASGQKALRSELVRLWAEHNTAAGDTTKVDAEYLEVIATRNGAQDAPGPHLLKKETPANSRAALLADRIEQGAAGLAAFAEGISEVEWHLPVSSTDHRSVGVIVHHVATMYPIEIDVARAVAGGNAVTDVSWDAVAQINAKHAEDRASATKAATLELLRKNSRKAAATVRALSDAELDEAAPFSLSSGAPMTAQFVIEDHALRHSWHHLAKIRAALKR